MLFDDHLVEVARLLGREGPQPEVDDEAVALDPLRVVALV